MAARPTLLQPHAQHSGLFSPLAPDRSVFDKFLAHCHCRRYPNRTEIFRPGDPANTLYYVISGSLSVISEEADGRELVLSYINPGEFVGELGLFVDAEQREVQLRARRDRKSTRLNSSH